MKAYPEGIYFTDSVDYQGEQPSPEFVAKVIKRLANPDYRYGKLAPQMAKAARLPLSARKSYPNNTILGMHGLTYAVCEQMEFGYGIFTGYTDDEYLLTWLDPMLFFHQEQLIFKVFNWTTYLKNVGQRGSSADWSCTVGTYSDVPVQGCEFNYCFEPNRHNSFGVPAGLKPGDVVAPCITQPVINIMGTRITGRAQLQQYALLWGVRLHMLDRLFDGDYCASPTTDNGQEDGVLKFFDNFATRHQYLSQTCLDEFSPVTDNVPVTAVALSTALGYTVVDTPAAIAAAQVEYVVRTISSHISDVEWRLKDIDGGSNIPFSDIGVMMNVADAQCMVWYQFCQAKCCGTTIAVSNFNEMNQFYRDFQTRLHGGLYGGGTLRLHDGREISIMPFRRIPQGTVLVIIKGWSGSQPNPYGFRVAGMQYNQWLNEVQQVSPATQSYMRLILNGTGVQYQPLTNCGDIEVRWNQRLFSNAPWMQLKIVGLPACNEVHVDTWPALPSLTAYTGCTPYGCEALEQGPG